MGIEDEFDHGGFHNHPIHILRNMLRAFKTLKSRDSEAAESMKPELIALFEQEGVGGVSGFKSGLRELKEEGFDIGTLEDLGVDLSWLPANLRQDLEDIK